MNTETPTTLSPIIEVRIDEVDAELEDLRHPLRILVLFERPDDDDGHRHVEAQV